VLISRRKIPWILPPARLSSRPPMRPAIFDILNWVLASRLWHLGTDCPCRPRALTRRPGPSPGQGTRPTKGNRFPASSPRFRKTSAHPPPGWHCRRAAFAAQLRRSDLSVVESPLKIQSPGGVTYSAHGLAPRTVGHQPVPATNGDGFHLPTTALKVFRPRPPSRSRPRKPFSGLFKDTKGYERIKKPSTVYAKKVAPFPSNHSSDSGSCPSVADPLDLKPPKVYERIR